jgi:acetyl-CoA acetyltransferase
MMTAMRDATAIVGIGETTFYKRGKSYPRTSHELAGQAIKAAVADAGLTLDDVDGITLYANGAGLDMAILAQTLGIPRLRLMVVLPGTGGGSTGAVGIAAAAIHAGMASVVVTASSMQVGHIRPSAGYSHPFTGASTWDFIGLTGLIAPGQTFAMMARRHMHLYGTTREHLGAVAVASRAHACRLESSVMRDPISMDDYLSSRMISEPLCLLDYCQETDGAVACVTTSFERARDLRQPPVLIRAAAQGGEGRWGQGNEGLQMPEEYFATAGFRAIANELYSAAGLGPDDVDVVELYDQSTAMVLMQLEDLGFCKPGESGPFALSGATAWPDGNLPVNTHGGSHSNAHVVGMTHVVEAVRQLRGQAVNQVPEAETALVTGAPGRLPMSAIILRRS